MLRRRRRRGAPRLARRAAGGAAASCAATSACSPARSTRASRTTRFRTCGREGPPITSSTSARPTRDAPHAWGANMTIRRSALERVGRVRRALASCYGDEQEWQAALRAAGGRIRYVAAAALDHRRAGDDARLRSLARAAYAPRPARAGASTRQGRARRRCAAELRVLAGCARARPALRAARTGPVMAAHTLGRLREALRRPAAPPATPGVDDFLSGRSGTVGGRARRAARAARRAARRARRCSPPARAAARAARAARRAGGSSCSASSGPRQRCMDARARRAQRSRHEVDDRARARRATRGKFENLNALLGRATTSTGTTGCSSSTTTSRCRAASSTASCTSPSGAGLRLAQPAHRLHSHAAWPVTRRRPAQRRARDDVRRDRPGDRVPPRHVRDAAAVPRPAHGLGPRRALGRARARARLADRRRRRDAGPPHVAPGGERLPARGGGRRGARVPRRPRPYVRRDEVAHAARRTGRRDEGRGRRRVLPARRRPGARRLGPPPGARRARRRRRRARARPAPPDPAAGRPRRATSRARRCALRCASRGARELDGLEVALRAVRLAAARRAPTGPGARGRRRRCAVALRAAAARASRSTSSTPTTPCPAGDAVRRARRRRAARRLRPRRRRLPHRAALRRRARARSGARSAPRGSCSPTARHRARVPRARRRAHARRAPRHRRARAERRARPTRPDARDRRAPRRPQAPRRRRCARCALLRDRRPACATSSSATGPERAPLERLAAELGVADRVELAGQLPHAEALRARARRATCSCMPSVDEAFGVAYVEAMAGRRARDRRARRARARGDRARRRRDAARPARRLEALAGDDRARCSPTATAARARRARARDASRARSPGSAAGARPSPPTRTRCA